MDSTLSVLNDSHILTASGVRRSSLRNETHIGRRDDSRRTPQTGTRCELVCAPPVVRPHQCIPNLRQGEYRHQPAVAHIGHSPTRLFRRHIACCGRRNVVGTAIEVLRFPQRPFLLADVFCFYFALRNVKY